MADFVTKDSGERMVFATGSVRDTDAGKPRFELIPLIALKRLADLYARGSAKYGDRNWERGQKISRLYGSLLRHVYAWAEGETTEDHLVAAAWNAFAIIWTLDRIERGLLPADLDDLERP